MLILLALATSPILLKILMGDTDNDKQRKKLYLIICGIIITLVIGLRHYTVGTRDTSNYCSLFEGALSFLNLRSFLSYHKVFENGFFLSECIFYIFTYFIAKVFSNAQIFILITTAVITFSVMRFIYRHSKNVMLSTVMYICLGLMTFNMNGMRQALAMAICLFAYDFADKKKIIPFLLITLLAMLVHRTAIFFLLVYLIARLKGNYVSLALFTIAVVLFMLFADSIVSVFDNVTEKNYSDAGSFDSGGYVTIVIYGLVLVFSLFFGWGNRNEGGFNLPFFLTILGLALYCGRYTSVQIYERMSYYFFYAVILLLPRSMQGIKSKENLVITITVTALSLFLFAYRLYGSAFHNFMFFWG